MQNWFCTYHGVLRDVLLIPATTTVTLSLALLPTVYVCPAGGQTCLDPELERCKGLHRLWFVDRPFESSVLTKMGKS